MIDPGDNDTWWEESHAFARRTLQSEESDFQADVRRRKEESEANKEFYRAVLAARESAESDGIHPARDGDGILELTAHQGIKAACLGREDISTVLRVQPLLLERLHRLHFLERTTLECSTALLKVASRNRTMLWVVISLLAYIAVKVS